MRYTRNEARLRESEKYRLIVEMADRHLADGPDTPLHLSIQPEKMLGYLPDEMIETVYSFMFEEDLGDHNERMETECRPPKKNTSAGFVRRQRTSNNSISDAPH